MLRYAQHPKLIGRVKTFKKPALPSWIPIRNEIGIDRLVEGGEEPCIEQGIFIVLNQNFIFFIQFSESIFNVTFQNCVIRSIPKAPLFRTKIR